jgi:hypothetical protein
MKELMKRANRGLNESVSNNKVIYCYDSSRTLGYTSDMGELTKNCGFVNLRQREFNSHWFDCVAQALTAIKHPELVERIANGEIKLYDVRYGFFNIEHRLLKDGDRLNEFQLEQLNTIVEMAKKFNIGPTKDGKEVIDLLIDDKMREKFRETLALNAAGNNPETVSRQSADVGTFAIREEQRKNDISGFGRKP